MSVLEALDTLGLTVRDVTDEAAIQRAWKQGMKRVHPDKNFLMSTTESTRLTQKLNEARDILFNRLRAHQPAQTAYGHEQERMARERERAEQAAREKREADERAREDELFKKQCDAWYEKGQEARRERFVKNRRKRAPGTRVHKRIGDYREGKALIQEMTAFFHGNLMVQQCNKLPVQDILDHFINSRESTSDLEINLFRRHCKTLLMTVWEDTVYSTLRNQRCFMHLNIKK